MWDRSSWFARKRSSFFPFFFYFWSEINIQTSDWRCKLSSEYSWISLSFWPDKRSSTPLLPHYGNPFGINQGLYHYFERSTQKLSNCMQGSVEMEVSASKLHVSLVKKCQNMIEEKSGARICCPEDSNCVLIRGSLEKAYFASEMLTVCITET